MSRGVTFDGRRDAWTDGGMDGTVHFVFPGLPEHTTMRDVSDPKIRNLIRTTILAIVQYSFYMDLRDHNRV